MHLYKLPFHKRAIYFKLHWVLLCAMCTVYSTLKDIYVYSSMHPMWISRHHLYAKIITCNSLYTYVARWRQSPKVKPWKSGIMKKKELTWISSWIVGNLIQFFWDLELYQNRYVSARVHCIFEHTNTQYTCETSYHVSIYMYTLYSVHVCITQCENMKMRHALIKMHQQ